MSLNENELQQYLGGSPKEVIKEFPRVEEKETGELSEEDLMNSLGGSKYGVAVEQQLDKTNIFSDEVLAREKETAMMLGELEQPEQKQTGITK